MLNEKRLSAELIAECRKRLSLRGENLKGLALGTGLAYGYVRLIMSRQRCSAAAMQKICDYLGIEEKIR